MRSVLPIVFALCLLQSTTPLWAAQENPQQLNVQSVQPLELEDEIHYDLRDVDYQSDTLVIKADRALLRLDRAKYLGDESDLSEPQAPTQQAQATKPLLGEQIQNALLGALGVSQENNPIVELLLLGNVSIEQESSGLSLMCSEFRFDSILKRTHCLDVDSHLPNGGAPNNWPTRVLAESLLERSDGTIKIDGGRLTTCLHPQPHYAIGLESLKRIPAEQPGEQEKWQPSGVRLLIGDWPILPLPSFEFTEGDAVLGLRRAKLLSGRAWGAALQVEIANESSWKDGSVHWALQPGYSVRRGAPLFFDTTFQSRNYTGEWSLFALQDQGEDVHPVAKQFSREDSLRWRARLNNRWEWANGWRLDADFSLTSDPLVDLEFFQQDWMLNDDAVTDIHLHHTDDNSWLSADLVSRLDKVGETPFTYFGSSTNPAPQTLDELPSLSFTRFATSTLSVPTSLLGGKNRSSDLFFSWGANASRQRLRSRDLSPPDSNPNGWAKLPDQQLDSLSAWTDLSLPLHLGPVSIQPGVRSSGWAWKEDFPQAKTDSSLFTETYLDLGLTAQRLYQDGWIHRLRPTISFLDRQIASDSKYGLPSFDGFSTTTVGKAASVGFRQSFYAPTQKQPWFDVAAKKAWYPEATTSLIHPLFPGARSGDVLEGWGPTEVRFSWLPNRPGEALRGLRWSGNFRWSADNAPEEAFTQIGLRPNPGVLLNVGYRKYLDRYEQLSVSGGWRIADSFGIRFTQTYNLTGQAYRVNRASALFFGHDFFFEAEIYRNEYTGDSGVFFTISPRFLAERFGSQGLPRMSGTRDFITP